MLRIAILGLTYAAFGWTAHAQTPAPSKPLNDRKPSAPEGTPPPAASDVELVERVIASRKEYENNLKTLYDRQLNERGRAIELYREEIAHDTDADRIRQAERRLGELTGNRK